MTYCDIQGRNKIDYDVLRRIVVEVSSMQDLKLVESTVSGMVLSDLPGNGTNGTTPRVIFNSYRLY